MEYKIDHKFHILDAMTGGGPFDEKTAEVELELYVQERLAELERERDEAYRRVGEADAQRMAALRKNEAAWQEHERLERELKQAQEANRRD